jgi:C1A family cysteine protease
LERCLGGHCVLLVGYDDTTQQFTCMNSWGPHWGLDGFFKIPYNYILNPKLADEFWVLTYYN